MKKLYMVCKPSRKSSRGFIRDGASGERLMKVQLIYVGNTGLYKFIKRKKVLPLVYAGDSNSNRPGELFLILDGKIIKVDEFMDWHTFIGLRP